MRYVRVVNSTTGGVLAERAEVAESWWARFRGLQLQRGLPAGGGLVLVPTSSIHMFFMRMSLDAVFVAADGRVVRVARGLRPWRSLAFGPGALYCVELPEGAAAATEPGHVIALHAVSQ